MNEVPALTGGKKKKGKVPISALLTGQQVLNPYALYWSQLLSIFKPTAKDKRHEIRLIYLCHSEATFRTETELIPHKPQGSFCPRVHTVALTASATTTQSMIGSSLNKNLEAVKRKEIRRMWGGTLPVSTTHLNQKSVIKQYNKHM